MVCVGDALAPSVAEQGPYSGMVVDLFAQGQLLPQLCEIGTWQQLRGMLVPGGRLVVNIGGVGMPGSDMGERALAALAAAFDGVLCKRGVMGVLCAYAGVGVLQRQGVVGVYVQRGCVFGWMLHLLPFTHTIQRTHTITLTHTILTTHTTHLINTQHRGGARV